MLLGSNLGNRELYLNEAKAYITENITRVLQQSGVYETQSWGRTNAPDYLNQVIIIDTDFATVCIAGKGVGNRTENGQDKGRKVGRTRN